MCFLDLLRGQGHRNTCFYVPGGGPLSRHSRWVIEGRRMLGKVEKPPTVLGKLIEGQHTRCSFDVFGASLTFSPSTTFDNLRRSEGPSY